jgi:hypothetical protein
MTDYHPLIARAVAGLEKSSGDARRALYERARAALVAQLRSVTPALNESDITRERLALEEAIRKVEAASARQTFVEAPRPEPTHNKIRPPEMPRWDDLRIAASPEPQSAPQPRPDASPRRPSSAPRPANGAATNGMLATASHVDPTIDPPIADAQQAAPQRHPLRRPVSGEHRSLLDSGLSNFRNVVSETDELGEASARSVKSARDIYDDLPPTQDLDHRGSDMTDPYGGREKMQDVPAPHLLEPAIDDDARSAPARVRMPAGDADEDLAPGSGRSWRGYLKLAAALLIIVGFGGGLLVLWPTLSHIYRSLRMTTPTEIAADPATPAATGRTKITERFESGGQQSQPAQNAAVSPGAAVAQRVVLYEEDPADPQGKRFVGSAIWRTETISPGPGQPPELAIRADVEIPERGISMTWSLRRNADPNLPASHTVEIVFKLPQDFPAGGVSNVPGILMKQAEQTRGTPLSGLAVKVTNGFFLIGLSSIETDRDRNLQLLKERAWFDIPVVYNNNRRAILALEKGGPGERVFADAFRAWRQ